MSELDLNLNVSFKIVSYSDITLFYFELNSFATLFKSLFPNPNLIIMQVWVDSGKKKRECPVI